MPTTTALTAIALRELRLGERSPAGRSLLAALVEEGDAPSDMSGLAELLACVANDPDHWRRRRVVEAVLAFGAGGTLGTAALLVVLGPELGVARRRLLAAGMDVDLAESELVEALLAAVETLPDALAAGAEAGWLVRRIDVTARRGARAWRREAQRAVPLEELDEPATDDDDPARIVSTLLAEAAAAGALSTRQASLVHAVRVADGAPAFVARTQRRTERAVRAELNRAEAALRAYLVSNEEEPAR